MLYIIPDYYKEFVCIADQCEDTCCTGWQIVIDKKSLKKYRRVKGGFRKRLLRSIHWREGIFKQTSDKRCTFLNSENLCDMYTVLGKTGLCRTCRLYPRHIEEFEGVREITLSVSCPEAARILLSRKEPVRFLQYEKEGDEEYEDFNVFLYSYLVDAREVMIRILQDRTKDLAVRTGLVLGLACDLESHIRRGRLFTCGEVLEKYETERAEHFIKGKLEEESLFPERNLNLRKEMFRKLYELEVLKADWYMLLRESERILYNNAENSQDLRERYAVWQQESKVDWQIILEQLLVYFIFTYFCGAVYDGRVYVKVQMAAVCVLLISELMLARWVRNESSLDMEDVIEIVYRFSRELEHSDENLEKFERIMEKHIFQWFSSF